MSGNEDCIQAIVKIGFTELEASIYTFLAQESASATGYRIAQAIGKPAANTYKALESLERKGAVVVDEGENRVFCAVPPDELLAGLKKQFYDHHEKAASALARMAPPPVDDRLYQLRSRTQVLERGRAMLKRCETVAVLDLFPQTVQNLQPEIEKATARGVDVVVKVYEPVELSGAQVIVRPKGYEIVDAIPGTLLSMNIDGKEHLLAMLAHTGDIVHQAVWTSSSIVAYLLYNGLVNEVSQVAVMDALDSKCSADEIRVQFQQMRRLHPISSRGPVYQNLLKQLGLQTEPLNTVFQG